MPLFFPPRLVTPPTSDPARPASLRSRLIDWAYFVVPIVLVIAVVLSRPARGPAKAVPTPGAPTTGVAESGVSAATAAALDGVRIALPAGQTEFLATTSAQQVVLFASTRCGHCHRMLERLATTARGDSLPYLRVIILEGPDEGAKMLRDLGLRAAVVGPAPDAQTFMAQTRAMGTPMWWAVGPTGRVRQIQLGALTEAELPRWATWARTGVPAI